MTASTIFETSPYLKFLLSVISSKEWLMQSIYQSKNTYHLRCNEQHNPYYRQLRMAKILIKKQHNRILRTKINLQDLKCPSFKCALKICSLGSIHLLLRYPDSAARMLTQTYTYKHTSVQYFETQVAACFLVSADVQLHRTCGSAC